jgi:hypothetical protein
MGKLESHCATFPGVLDGNFFPRPEVVDTSVAALFDRGDGLTQGGAGFACGELGARVAAAAVGSLIGAHFGLELGGLLLDAVGDVEAAAGSEQSKEDNDGENAEENLDDGIAAGSGDRRGCIGWSRSGRL